MTTVALALPVLGLILLQAAEHNQEPRQRAREFALGQAAPKPQSPTAPGGKAFDKLFKQAQKAAAGRAAATPKPDRKIVCGTVVIQVDDALDPKFVQRAPEDTSGLKIRAIQPPACAD